MKKNYYDILGVSKDATEADIKKAYKKLALKYHPDRQNGKSEAEKKEAEERFKEVNEANDTLSDPKKRQEYDNPGFGAFGGYESGFGMGGRDPWEEMFNMHGNRGTSIKDYHGEDCEAKLNIDINDLYFKGVKSVAFLKNVRCHTCNGEGGTGIKTCSYCNGTGNITESRQQGNMFFQSMRPCPYCNGIGKTVEKKCSDCSGTGFIGKLYKEDINLANIPIQYLLMDGVRVNCGQHGSDSKNPNGTPGTLYVTIQHAYDHDKYKVDSTGNIEAKTDVDWKDLLLGNKVEVHLPNQTMRVVIPECCETGKKLRLKGKGIDGHDYTIVINPTFPTKLDEDTKKAIKKLKDKEAKQK